MTVRELKDVLKMFSDYAVVTLNDKELTMSNVKIHMPAENGGYTFGSMDIGASK